MNVSNVFYEDWECFNEVLPCLLLANRPHRGTQVDRGEWREERGPRSHFISANILTFFGTNGAYLAPKFLSKYIIM